MTSRYALVCRGPARPDGCDDYMYRVGELTEKVDALRGLAEIEEHNEEVSFYPKNTDIVIQDARVVTLH